MRPSCQQRPSAGSGSSPCRGRSAVPSRHGTRCMRPGPRSGMSRPRYPCGAVPACRRAGGGGARSLSARFRGPASDAAGVRGLDAAFLRPPRPTRREPPSGSIAAGAPGRRIAPLSASAAFLNAACAKVRAAVPHDSACLPAACVAGRPQVPGSAHCSRCPPPVRLGDTCRVFWRGHRMPSPGPAPDAMHARPAKPGARLPHASPARAGPGAVSASDLPFRHRETAP